MKHTKQKSSLLQTIALSGLIFSACLVVGIVLTKFVSTSFKSESTETTSSSKTTTEQTTNRQIEHETFFEFSDYTKVNDIIDDTPTAINTPPWAIYSNITYDFSFQFPSEWFLNKEDLDMMSIGTHLPAIPGPGHKYGIEIIVFENEGSTDLKSLIDEITSFNARHGLSGEPEKISTTGSLVDMYYIPVDRMDYLQSVYAKDNKQNIIKIYCYHCDTKTTRHIIETLQSPRVRPGK